MNAEKRHRCTHCGRPRSRDFHQRFPIGLDGQTIKGVCSRCLPEKSIVHIHYHYWTDHPEEARQVRGKRRDRASSMACSEPPPTRGFPPEYSEVPRHRDNIHERRAELPVHEDSVHTSQAKVPTQQEKVRRMPVELPAHPNCIYDRRLQIPIHDIPQDERPPPVGPKPLLRRLSNRLRLFLDN
jgi:hypothetical protein